MRVKLGIVADQEFFDCGGGCRARGSNASSEDCERLRVGNHDPTVSKLDVTFSSEGI